ncbi:hypothetical protein Bca4012_004382 [Brassica carinata]
MFRYYKAFRKMVKIYCGLGEYEKMMDATRKMLKYIKGSYQGDSVYRFLQSLCTYGSLDLNMLQELCKITMEALEENKKQYLILKELHKYYQNVDETNDVAKTRDLRKVYVIEFQLYTETDDKRNQKSNLEHDTFINCCKEDMLEKMRTQAILNLLERYTTKIEISVISTKMGVKEDEGMELLRLLILNNGVHWLVDEVEGLLGER